MRKLSLFKKIKLFNVYKKSVLSNKDELFMKYNIRIDKASRLYTVINIPEELIGEAFSMKKSDIDRISENYVKIFSNELSDYLKSKDLSELFDFYSIEKVGKYSYLVVYGFSLFKSQKYYNTIYYVLIPILIISALVSLFLIF